MIQEPPLDPVIIMRLQDIYGDVLPDALVNGIATLLMRIQDQDTNSDAHSGRDSESAGLWSEKDCVLITYADQVSGSFSADRTNPSPLASFLSFMQDYGLTDLLPIVHLLPFYPWTSDDGFSVSDYRSVKHEYGTWDDIAELRNHVDLMFDLVLNHCSAEHQWFKLYLQQQAPYNTYFIDTDPKLDLSHVVRPRSSPVLTPFDTSNGRKYVWTTFSSDQVDLNFSQPLVLLEMLQTLVDYAQRGARIIRLDAIAYLWKDTSTPCIHLPETHAVVKLMRRVLELTFPRTILLTETNVPHKENMSYFGTGDEAHVVYQFSLPPLMLDSIHHEDATLLTEWLDNLEPPYSNTTFLNFTASHDGVGVRPLEGLVSRDRIDQLVARIRSHGGAVSMKRNPDGTESPYELNITYMDAVANANRISPREHAFRFLGTQAVMLALRGLPAIYFHSLIGSPNNLAGMVETGRNRTINRKKMTRVEIDQALGTTGSSHSERMRCVFNGYQKLLDIRRRYSAFHPNAAQRVLRFQDPAIFGFVRGNDQPTQPTQPTITVLANFSSQPKVARIECNSAERVFDCIADAISLERTADGIFSVRDAIPLRPYQVRWLIPSH